MRYYDFARGTATHFLNWAGNGGWARVFVFVAAAVVFSVAASAIIATLFYASERTLLVLILLVLIFKKG